MGGWGVDVTRLRSLGSTIGHRINAAGGAIPFIKILNDIALAVDQNGKRAGAFAIYMESWCIDFPDFLDMCKRSGEERRRGQDLFYAVSASDLFIKRIKENSKWTLFDPRDVPELSETWGEEFEKHYLQAEEDFLNGKRKFNPNTKQIEIADLVSKMMYNWVTEGKLFWFFKDTVNRAHEHKHLGIIRSSNLCVTADTYILTQEYGNIQIGLLVESGITEATCWNGKEWSLTTLAKTSDSAELMEVKLNNFTTIKATPYHKWYVVNDDYNGYREVRTHELKPGDKLIRYNLPTSVVSGQEILPNAYTTGLFAADGCETGYGSGVLHLYNEKIALLPYLTGYSSVGNITTTNENNNLRQSVYFRNSALLPKLFVPNSVFRLQDRLNWLAGLIDGDGTLTSNQNAQSIQLSSTQLDFLVNIRLMLQELGVDAKVQQLRQAGMQLLPTNKGDGSVKEYYCNTSYRLLISGAGINRLLELGYTGYRIKPVYHKYNRIATEFVKVTSVTALPWESATYCGNEPKRHMLMFNGVLTGNCVEITMPTDENRTAVCNLGSINLSRVESIEDLTKTSKLAARFLDDVIDVTEYHSERAEKTQKAMRSFGCGTIGEAEYIATRQIHYGSPEHIEVIKKLYGTISNTLKETSIELAKERGSCEAVPGIRNAYRMAIAPNTSTSLFAGSVASCEPIYAKETVEISKLGNYKVMAPNINIDNIAYYKNAFEIDQKVLIDANAVRQQFVDMSISQSLYIDATDYMGTGRPVSAMDIIKLIIRAHSKGLKTLYYFRSKAKKNDSTITGKGGIVCSGCEN